MLLTFKRKLFLSVKYIECTWKNKTGSISYFLLYILNEFVNRLNWIHFYGTVDVNLLAKRKLSNKHLNYIIILNYVFKYIKSINRCWYKNTTKNTKSRKRKKAKCRVLISLLPEIISTFLFLRIFESTYRVFTLISIGNTKIIKQENRKSLYSIRLQWSHYIVHIRYSIETMYSLQFIVNYIEIRIAESLIFCVLLCEPLSVFFWP